MDGSQNEEISARVERLLTAQPAAPPEARRVRRSFAIEETWREGPRYVGMRIRVDAEFADAYRRPGQYVTLKVEGWPARFYVIAARPEKDLWEFLVDGQGELGPVLAGLEAGDEVLVSMPEGVGFDPGEASGEIVTMFCTGSGLATMRPLLERWFEYGEDVPQSAALYYGERRSGDFAYEELLSRWASSGLTVARAAERGGLDEIPHEYVQDAFDADHPPVDDAFAYLSGAPVMIQIVAEKLLNLGVSPSRIKVNI